MFPCLGKYIPVVMFRHIGDSFQCLGKYFAQILPPCSEIWYWMRKKYWRDVGGEGEGLPTLSPPLPSSSAAYVTTACKNIHWNILQNFLLVRKMYDPVWYFDIPVLLENKLDIVTFTLIELSPQTYFKASLHGWAPVYMYHINQLINNLYEILLYWEGNQ